MTNVKIITYKGKEYKYVIDAEPASYCDICAFRELCGDVLCGKMSYEESPMPICERLSEEFNTHFASFVKC